MFPIIANPIHWSHVINGLSAIARLKLDKLIYIVTAGLDNKKSDMPPVHLRYSIARNIIKIFDPLLVCAPYMCDAYPTGETDVFSILRLNSELTMDVYYLIGTDQGCRFATDLNFAAAMQKSEHDSDRTSPSFQRNKHRMYVAAFGHRIKNKPLNQFLTIKTLPRSPFEISYHLLQDVLRRKVHQTALAFLPFTVYRYMCTYSLYGDCPHEFEMLQSAETQGVIQNMYYPELTL